LAVQRKESEEEMFDIQKREMAGGSKNETPIEMEGVAIERMERRAQGFHRDHKTGRQWMWIREVSVWELIIESGNG
jgi:hypothetical protein